MGASEFFQSDYTRFRDKLWFWENADLFIAQSFLQDGIHQIGLSNGRYFDLLLRGVRGKYNDVPVFFNGAVDRANTKPPYFSGSNVAVEASLPVISVTDPTLNLSSDLGIGWYRGGVGSPFESILTKFLRYLSDATGARPIMVGGSAGRFVALRFGSLLGQSALVWNPQIDFLRYNQDHIGKFLSRRFMEPAWETNSSKMRDENGAILIEPAHKELEAAGHAMKLIHWPG